MNWKRRIDSVEVFVGAVGSAGVQLGWRAWNRLSQQRTGMQQGRLAIPAPRADCDAVHLLVKRGQYRLQELGLGDRVELSIDREIGSGSVATDVKEIHIYTHRWDSLIDDPCSVWLYAAQGEDPLRPLLVAYHRDRRLVDLVLSDPTWTFGEVALLAEVGRFAAAGRRWCDNLPRWNPGSISGGFRRGSPVKER